MNVVLMSRFGRTLTDREFGKTVANTIVSENQFPVVLDFKGVMALGSSCGDEIVNAVAAKQGGQVQVINANQAIKSCLGKVAEDLKVTIKIQ
jgi:anti-anti-sigma regulatory factor